MKQRMQQIALALCLALCITLCCACTGAPAATQSETQPQPTATQPKNDAVITTAAESYTVTETEAVAIEATLTTSATGISLSYTSQDPDIATVSKYGKIRGVSAGSTYIVIRSSDGVEKTVNVTVEKRVVQKILRLALNVMWNDTALGCFNNETGEVLEITQDGQYTLSFNCADMSAENIALGVTGLNNLTSIYIKDYDVTTAQQVRSNVVACQIRWDQIIVDGVELTITNSEFKDAMKSNGVFDTNDPFNAWDGSSVEEVTVDTENHVLNINLDNPQVVCVTFTISGMTFAE